MRFDLSDEEWSVLEPLMPKSRKSARPHDRRIINAIFYVLRTGIPWRENFFCRIKDWRRIATRYDKLARNFLAAAALIGALYWIKL
jgi:transposase